MVPVTALSNCRRDTWPFLLFGKPPPRDVGLRQPHSFLVAECSKAQWGPSSPGPGCQVLHSRGEAASKAEGTWTPQGQGLGLTQSPAESASIRTQEVCAQWAQLRPYQKEHSIWSQKELVALLEKREKIPAFALTDCDLREATQPSWAWVPSARRGNGNNYNLNIYVSKTFPWVLHNLIMSILPTTCDYYDVLFRNGETAKYGVCITSLRPHSQWRRRCWSQWHVLLGELFSGPAAYLVHTEASRWKSWVNSLAPSMRMYVWILKVSLRPPLRSMPRPFLTYNWPPPSGESDLCSQERGPGKSNGPDQT